MYNFKPFCLYFLKSASRHIHVSRWDQIQNSVLCSKISLDVRYDQPRLIRFDRVFVTIGFLCYSFIYLYLI